MGTVYLWTGEGAGKTTSVFGAALRAVGQCKRVVVVQFMKGRKDTGEYRVAKKLKPWYDIHQFGRRGWINLKKPSRTDKALACRGLEFAHRALEKKPFLLILDEVALACAAGLLRTRDVVEFLDSVPTQTRVFMTGRRAPRALRKRADFVNVVRTLKRPKKMKAIRGIEY